jgi:hypothetical protein
MDTIVAVFSLNLRSFCLLTFGYYAWYNVSRSWFIDSSVTLQEARMRKVIKVVVLLVLLTGCERFVEYDMRVGASNGGFHQVTPVVNNQKTRVVLAPGKPEQFTVKIAVPVVMGPTEPTSADKVILVPVYFLNLETGTSTREIYCEVGARIVSNLRYEATIWHQQSGSHVQSQLNEYASCRSTR